MTLAANADVFAPGDAQGQRTTTDKQHIPSGYRFSPPQRVNALLGAGALLAVWWLAHHARKRGKR